MSTIATSTNIRLTLDISPNQKTDKKYNLGEVAFINTESEKGIYIGLGTGPADNPAIKIYNSNDIVSSSNYSNIAGSANSLNISQPIGNANIPVFFSATGFPMPINFMMSATVIDNDEIKGTSIIGQSAIETLIDSKLNNISHVLHFKGVQLDIPETTDGWNEGDVIIVGKQEYVFVEATVDGVLKKYWESFGDEENYVSKDYKILTDISNTDYPIFIDNSVMNGTSTYIYHRNKNNIISDPLSPATTMIYGTSSAIPQITVDKWGHIDNVTTIPIDFPHNAFNDYTVSTTQLATTTNNVDKKTLLTQNVIIDQLNSVENSLISIINNATTELHDNINDLGALKYIGNFSNIPIITKVTADGDDHYYINYVNSGNVGTEVLSGNLITTDNGDQYILEVGNGTANWKTWGNASNYALKTISVTGTGVLGGGGELNDDIEITHNKSNVRKIIQLGATTSDNIGGIDDIPVISVDTYGHIHEIETVPSKLKGYYITNTATDIIAATASAIITQAGIEDIINATLNAWKSSFSNPLSYKGIKTEFPASAITGDIILVPTETQSEGHRFIEYIYSGTAWESIGEENVYAYKETKVIGTGILGGGGSLENDREITHKTSGVNAGIYGGDNLIPILTINDWGHVTNVATSTITIPTYTGPKWKVIRTYNNE